MDFCGLTLSANLLGLTLSAWHPCILRPRYAFAEQSRDLKHLVHKPLFVQRYPDPSGVPSFQQKILLRKEHQWDAELAHRANISRQLVAVFKAEVQISDKELRLRWSVPGTALTMEEIPSLSCLAYSCKPRRPVRL